MVPLKRFFVLVPLITVLANFVTTGCGADRSADTSQGTETLSTAPSSSGKGLYVFDGTGVDDGAKARTDGKSNMADLWHRWPTYNRLYSKGPNLSADNVKQIADEARILICRDARRGMRKAYFAGYSRGAIIAVTLATEFARSPKLCGNKHPVQPAWVGMVDAVDTSMDNTWSRSLPRPGGRVVPNIHIVKKDKSEHLLTTRTIERSTEVRAAADAGGNGHRNHKDVGWNKTVLAQLIDSARSAGAPLQKPQTTQSVGNVALTSPATDAGTSQALAGFDLTPLLRKD